MEINAAYTKIVEDALSDLREDPSLTPTMAVNNGLDDMDLSEEEAEEVYFLAIEEIHRQTRHLDAYDRSPI